MVLLVGADPAVPPAEHGPPLAAVPEEQGGAFLPGPPAAHSGPHGW